MKLPKRVLTGITPWNLTFGCTVLHYTAIRIAKVRIPNNSSGEIGLEAQTFQMGGQPVEPGGQQDWGQLTLAVNEVSQVEKFKLKPYTLESVWEMRGVQSQK